ncbi:hypothetical protein CEK26_003419 [Fusarium fujikuroi]|nr:hypothetical protein CEK27_003411 [Fusarium fujikuroi]QGI88419.1 hypothetical protein CEK25_003375 [Fusarium fujikuroi]QGJ01975.1 hypothetical protein CEK26_003419 [Fusarium fujikuroi]
MATILAESITYLHSRGVMSGDISTGNVLIFSDDTLRICDFTSSALGIAPVIGIENTARGIIYRCWKFGYDSASAVLGDLTALLKEVPTD